MARHGSSFGTRSTPTSVNAAALLGIVETYRRHALLTNEEVLTVRLYSGPAYQPLNNFSASRHKCKGRTAMLSENILL